MSISASTGQKTLWVFTPSNTDPQDLEFILVQRHGLLQDAVARALESVSTDNKHHMLFVGPRGCGKTHLITLIVSRLFANSALAEQMRIAWLNEDETCASPLELLLKVHSALELRYPDEFRPEQLEPAYKLKPDAAFEFVSESLLKEMGPRTLVVVTENLDALLEGLADHGQKQLRAFIQENPRFCFVATAQRLVEDLSDRTRPFFGFFQTEHLKALNVSEAAELLRNIAKLHEKTDLEQFLSSSRGRSRVRALHHISGGNHRIYIVLSQFITRDSMDALIGPFMKMADELTPYYQERIRWLPMLQRRIVELLCRSERTVSVKEIAKRLFTTHQSISSQLKDLREKGYVKANQRGRESLYEVSEPLMRICVEVKENVANRPLRLLVDFLRVWYDDEELDHRLSDTLLTDPARKYLESALRRNRTEGNLRINLMLKELESPLRKRNMWESISETLPKMPEGVLVAIRCIEDSDNEGALTCFSEAIQEESHLVNRAVLLIARGAVFQWVGEHKKALADFSAAIATRNIPAHLLARALLVRAQFHRHPEDDQLAIEDYTAVIQLENAPVECLSTALLKRGVMGSVVGDPSLAIKDLTESIELNVASTEDMAIAFYSRGIARMRTDDNLGALEDYTSAIASKALPNNLFASCLSLRAVLFGGAGEEERAIEDLSTAIEMTTVPAELLASTLLCRGHFHFGAKRKRQAKADYDRVIHLIGAQPGEVLEAYLAAATLHFNEGDWKLGFQYLDESLAYGTLRSLSSVGNSANIASILFEAGLSPSKRVNTVKRLLETYQKHGLLAVLGEIVIQHLGELYRAGKPFPSTDNLESWISAWEDAAKSTPDFSLSLRLLRVAGDFLKAGGTDQDMLLDLASPERAILEQALGLSDRPH